MESPKWFACPDCHKPFNLETHGLESFTMHCPACSKLLLLQSGNTVVDFHKFMATQVEGWPADGDGVGDIEITYSQGEC